MAKFIIAPHMRLHEWVARDKGYFEREGLDCEFSDQLTSPDGKLHDLGDKVGAYQTFERGRSSNINCACHWTINVAASVGHGKLYPHAYSVAPGGGVRAARIARSRTPSNWPACRSRSAISRAATTRRSRRWNNICGRTRSRCPLPTGCCSGAWRS